MTNPLNPLSGAGNSGASPLTASLPPLPNVRSSGAYLPAAAPPPQLSAKEKQDQDDVVLLASEGGVGKLLQRLNVRAESIQENPVATLSTEASAQALLSRLSAAGNDVAQILAALGTADGPNLVEMWKILNQIYDQCKQGVTSVDTARLSKASQFTPEVVTYANGKAVPSLALSEASAKRLGQFIAAELKSNPASSFESVIASAISALSDDPSIQKALAPLNGAAQWSAALKEPTAGSASQATESTLHTILAKIGEVTGDKRLVVAAEISDVLQRAVTGKATTEETVLAISKSIGGDVEQATQVVVRMVKELAKGGAADLNVVVGQVAGLFGLSEDGAMNLLGVLRKVASNNGQGAVTVAEIFRALSQLKLISNDNAATLQRVGDIITKGQQIATLASRAKSTEDLVVALAAMGGPETSQLATVGFQLIKGIQAGTLNSENIAELAMDAFGGNKSKISEVKLLVTTLFSATDGARDPFALVQQVIAGTAKLLGPEAERTEKSLNKYVVTAQSLNAQLANPAGAKLENVLLTASTLFGERGSEVVTALVELKQRLDSGTFDEKSAAVFLAHTLKWSAPDVERTLKTFKGLAKDGIPTWDAAFTAVRETAKTIGGETGQSIVSGVDLAQKFTTTFNANGGNVVASLSASIPELANFFDRSSKTGLKEKLQTGLSAFDGMTNAASSRELSLAFASLFGQDAVKATDAGIAVYDVISKDGFDVEKIARATIKSLGGDEKNIDRVKLALVKMGDIKGFDGDSIAAAKHVLDNIAPVLGINLNAASDWQRYLIAGESVKTSLAQPGGADLNAIVKSFAGTLGEQQQRIATALLEVKDHFDKGTFSFEVAQKLLAETLGMSPEQVKKTIDDFKDLTAKGIPNFEAALQAVHTGAKLIGGETGRLVEGSVDLVKQFTTTYAETKGDLFASLRASVPQLGRLFDPNGVGDVAVRLESGFKAFDSFNKQGVGAAFEGGLTLLGTALKDGNLVKIGQIAEQGNSAWQSFQQGKGLEGTANALSAVSLITGSKEIGMAAQGLNAVNVMGSGVANGFSIGGFALLGVAGQLIGGDVGKALNTVSTIGGMLFGGPIGIALGLFSLLTDLFGWGKPPRAAKISTQNMSFVGDGANGNPALMVATQNGGESAMRINIKQLNSKIEDKPEALRAFRPTQGEGFGPDASGHAILLSNEWCYSGGYRFGINSKLGFVVQKDNGGGNWGTTWRAAVNPPPGSFLEINQQTGKLEVWSHASRVIPGEPPEGGYKRTSYVKIWESNRGAAACGSNAVLRIDGGKLETYLQDQNSGQVRWRAAEFSAAHDSGFMGIGSYHRDADEGHMVSEAGTMDYTTKGNYGYFDKAEQMMTTLQRKDATGKLRSDISFRDESGHEFVLYDLGGNHFDELSRNDYDRRVAEDTANWTKANKSDAASKAVKDTEETAAYKEQRSQEEKRAQAIKAAEQIIASKRSALAIA